MIKLLAVDMDGTCLAGRGVMTDRTFEALSRAAAQGIMVVPTTGRNLFCLPHRLSQGVFSSKSHGGAAAPLFRYCISSNGGRVTDVLARKTLFQAMLSRAAALEILERCRRIPLGLASHMNNRYLIQGQLFAWMGRMIYGQDAKGISCVRNMYKVIEKSRYPVEELQLYFAAPGAKAKVRQALEGFLQINAAYTGIYAEIFDKDASKGRALAALADDLNIESSEIACIGDGENDLSMFKVSGLKIAMGNSVPDLKAQADHVTADNRRDGAARAIYKYIL
ncbi:MAG TPA: HAD-IIB family hydrolase [Candidatus Scybalocola faecavium]|nr:HAD-IIB family hydrolase [Candidatus Scybalocola faecavium]